MRRGPERVGVGQDESRGTCAVAGWRARKVALVNAPIMGWRGTAGPDGRVARESVQVGEKVRGRSEAAANSSLIEEKGLGPSLDSRHSTGLAADSLMSGAW